MSTENCPSQNNFILIAVFTIISLWNGIHAEVAYDTTNHISVNLGDTIILDCDLATAGAILIYPVFWVKDSRRLIATKNKNGQPYIHSEYFHLRYSVDYSSSTRRRRFSLGLHRVEPYHTGEYTCYDVYQCHSPDNLCKSFFVSVVTCNCSLTEVIAGIDDNRVGVACILYGYQLPHAGNISVNITLDGSTTQGIVQSNILTTHVEAEKLCSNITMEFNLNPPFPYKIQCQVPRINPCPYHRSTAVPPAATTFQAHSLKTAGTTDNHASSSETTGYECIQHRTSLSSAPTTRKEMITYTSSSPINKHILIASITVVIVVIIVAAVTLCLIRRRNEISHKPYCHKPGTKHPGDKAHPTSSVDGKRVPSVDLVNETCEKTALSGQAYYANFKGTNGAHYQEDDSRIDLSCTIASDRITEPPTTQPFISTQISQDTELCSSQQITVIQESSHSCSQYESVDVDFHGGTEADDNMTGRCAAYQELMMGPSDLSSHYQPLHLYEGTGGDDPFVTKQQQFTHDSRAPLSQYESMDFPLATDEAENGDTHLYAACDEKPQSEKEKLGESSKGSIDESGIHVYANFDRRSRYGRKTKEKPKQWRYLKR